MSSMEPIAEEGGEEHAAFGARAGRFDEDELGHGLASGLAASPGSSPSAAAAQAAQAVLMATSEAEALPHPDWALLHRYAEHGRPVGYCLRHQRSGFLVELLLRPAGVVPQGLLWFSTLLQDDCGLAHALEHLLVGKGGRARYVAALEALSLSKSTAFTERFRTCYTFQTQAGVESFLALTEQKLAALVIPDYQDEEILREVCHVAPSADPTGGLWLSEEGTVYQEQVAAFERADVVAFAALHHLVYGPDHPLAYEAGGTPQGLQDVTVMKLRDFQTRCYNLHCGGLLAFLPLASASDLRAVLDALTSTLDNVFLQQVKALKQGRQMEAGHAAQEHEAAAAATVADGEEDGDDELLLLNPEPTSALMNPLTGDLPEWRVPFAKPTGSVDEPANHCHVTGFPCASASESGLMLFAWPNCIRDDPREGLALVGEDVLEDCPAGVEVTLLQVFASVFGDGNTSEIAVNRRSVLTSVGASGVACWPSSEKGRMLCLSLSGTQGSADHVGSRGMAAQVMRELSDALEHIASLDDGTEELREFNRRCLSKLKQLEKSSHEFLIKEPNLGTRGVYAEWLDHVHDSAQLHGRSAGIGQMESEIEFPFGSPSPCPGSQPLVELSFFESPIVSTLLGSSENIWRNLLRKWNIVGRRPMCVVALPDPQMKRTLGEQKEQRLQDAQLHLRQRLEAECHRGLSDAELLAMFSTEYHEKTKTIAATNDANEEGLRALLQPRFVKDPPLSSDPQLRYRTESLQVLLARRIASDVQRGSPRRYKPDDSQAFVIGSFRGMSGAHSGLALSLADFPSERLLYVPALPVIFSSVGVDEYQGCAPLSYKCVCECLQRDVLYLRLRLETCQRTRRCEAIINCAGLSLGEALRSIDWMERLLKAPLLKQPKHCPEAMALTPASIAETLRQACAKHLDELQSTLDMRPEFWAVQLLDSYLGQSSLVHLVTSCVITQAHCMWRVTWQLTSLPQDRRGRNQIIRLVRCLRDLEKNNRGVVKGNPTRFRSILRHELELVRDVEAPFSGASRTQDHVCARTHRVCNQIQHGSGEAVRLAASIGRGLLHLSQHLPDSSLSSDWVVLCEELEHDVSMSTETVLGLLSEVFEALCNSEGARAFITLGEGADTYQICTAFKEMIERLPCAAMQPPSETRGRKLAAKDAGCGTATPWVLQRAFDRGAYRPPEMLRGGAALPWPRYVALENARAEKGVLMSIAPCIQANKSMVETSPRDISNSSDCLSESQLKDGPLEQQVQEYLCAKAQCGGGGHTLFSHTWAAGLAYSSGLSCSAASGRLMYYADHCGSVLKTWRFASEKIEQAASLTPHLMEYALAQCFQSRAGLENYRRTESMAAALADKLTPEVEAALSRYILQMRENYGDELASKVQAQAGRVFSPLFPFSASAVDTTQQQRRQMKNPEQLMTMVVANEEQLAELRDSMEGDQHKSDDGESLRGMVSLHQRDFWVLSHSPTVRAKVAIAVAGVSIAAGGAIAAWYLIRRGRNSDTRATT